MNVGLTAAIQNQAAHCEVVLGAHGYASTNTGHLWTNEHTLDVPYGHAITLSGPENAHEQVRQIEQFLADRPSGAATVITDSYSCLDLGPLGLEVLFADPWLIREPASAEPGAETDLQIVEVNRSAELLRQFDEVDRAGFGLSSMTRSYLDQLLDDSRYRFLLGRAGDRIVSGVLTFNDVQTLGIYALVTLNDFRGRGYGNTMIGAALRDADRLPAVTNPSTLSHGLFTTNGFRQVGKRTLWIRKPDNGA